MTYNFKGKWQYSYVTFLFKLLFYRNCHYRDYIGPTIRLLININQLEECELVGETEVLEQNPSQCYFLHHKSHISWLCVILWLRYVPHYNSVLQAPYSQWCITFTCISFSASTDIARKEIPHLNSYVNHLVHENCIKMKFQERKLYCWKLYRPWYGHTIYCL